MKKPFTVNYDTSRGDDFEESFSTLRQAMSYYYRLSWVAYKNLTFDDDKRGTLTLLTSCGDDNLKTYGFYPCDY